MEAIEPDSNVRLVWLKVLNVERKNKSDEEVFIQKYDIRDRIDDAVKSCSIARSLLIQGNLRESFAE